MAVSVLGLVAPGSGTASAAPAHTVERVAVDSFDGTDLRGWLIRPAGVTGKIPAVLISSPYLGQCVSGGPCWPAPETPEDWAEHPEPVERLIEWGYAVGWFSVRGTGVSGGCFEDLGAREQRDQKVLVEWLADQPWSNGRVGAMGISYMSQTALAAATQAPKALKTVVVSGIVADLYTAFHTPQGLPLTRYAYPGDGPYALDISLSPPGLLRGDTSLVGSWASSFSERICPELVEVATEMPTGAATGSRDAAFWKERRLTDRFHAIKASVLMAHGLQDLWQSMHQMQEDDLWSRIPSAKASFTGQWEHNWPWQSGHSWVPSREDLKETWLSTLRSWLDHYLKGGRRPSIVGRVRYEDDARVWHESKAWPPREARDEALFLGPDGGLAAAPPAEEWSGTFRSYPQFDRITAKDPFLCPAVLDPAVGAGSLVFATEPVAERTIVAGNPVAYLDLASDQQGGAVQVTLFDLGPEFECSPTRRRPPGVRRLTLGGADLRFHRGNFSPRPFTEGHVRIDLANLAAVLEPGHRLAVTVSYGDPIEYAEVGHTPLITVRSGPRVDASQLVIPVIEGGFGGSPSKADIPPRP